MSNQETRSKRSPPETKRLSLENDCRDAYGENNKSKRKAIPRFKTASNRQGRHGAKATISSSIVDGDLVNEAALHAAEFKALHPSKRKTSDRPLGEVLQRKKS